jgi:predicted ester cyclase
MDIQVNPFCANENRSARAEGLVGCDRKWVSFTENVFYEFRAEKIAQVWSVKGKAGMGGGSFTVSLLVFVR